MHKRIGKELRDIIPSRLNEQNLIYDAYKCDYYYEKKREEKRLFLENFWLFELLASNLL